MPVHDWTRVEDGTFHDFHNAWIIHLKETLNGGCLPKGYYALSEQHALSYIADVLTLQTSGDELSLQGSGGGVSVLESPPKVSTRLIAQPSYKVLRKTLTVRRVSGHRIVALIEILSPGNKDRDDSIEQFVQKATDTVRNGCHLLMVDLFPPGKHDPQGMHGAIWDWWFDERYSPPKDQPLTLASYASRLRPTTEIYLENLAVGQSMPDMPLFLRESHYINIPLQPTYDQAFRGMPEIYRQVLEKESNGKRSKTR